MSGPNARPASRFMRRLSSVFPIREHGVSMSGGDRPRSILVELLSLRKAALNHSHDGMNLIECS